ncbi:MAG: hypothetical protein KDC53_09895 [Saprospiraceae bacterium]|nr:hypothetical protein [Saprospiraceae bacterium]
MRFLGLIGLCLYAIALPAQSSTSDLYQDVPFVQDYSVKYYLSGEDVRVSNVSVDRNQSIRIMTNHGILQPKDGRFLQPGTFATDREYLPMQDMEIGALGIYENQFIYVNRKAVFSNAWAGDFFQPHHLPGVDYLCMGDNFEFVISDGQKIEYFSAANSEGEIYQLPGEMKEMQYAENTKAYYLLLADGIYQFNPSRETLEKFIKKDGVTTFATDKDTIIIATAEGYQKMSMKNGQAIGAPVSKLPCPEITCLAKINDQWWFGSTEGAFVQRSDGKYDFYNGERWLASNDVVDIQAGPDHSVLILSKKGLAQIFFQDITLLDKATYFEEQVRLRHIRHGFNATLGDMEKGDIFTGTLKDSDNDGLWTSMYLAAEAFRYKVTGSAEALQNCQESLDAMERLYTINPVAGFPSRSFERFGYKTRLADPGRWQHATDPNWDWKSTTSSDEAIGHMFVFGVIAELVDDAQMQNQAIRLMDTLMSHIVKNDLYMIDYDGNPTTWGRWNPEYVNAFPIVVGDRKLNSSNIISMLQTAYYFTKKEKYKNKALELLYDYGYLDNLIRPINLIGSAPDGSDDWSKMLSESWNHSDDEMYYCGYWGLYRYALNDELKKKYKEAILDHWQAERPEKEGLWNIFTAITGTKDFDLKEAVWYLQQHPVDLINWAVVNSNRKDLDWLPDNFRTQRIAEVLPPDERPIQRHNSNMFNLDRTGGNGTSESSAGDIWLLPYWLGRYFGVISAPESIEPTSLTDW